MVVQITENGPGKEVYVRYRNIKMHQAHGVEISNKPDDRAFVKYHTTRHYGTVWILRSHFSPYF